METILCLESNLFFALRLADAIRTQSGRPVIVETPAAFVDAMDREFPVLALVDLDAPGDWAAAIARCKLRPHSRQTPIYAFGAHVNVEQLQAARAAGADYAWARSRMMAELPALVERHLHPPVRYPAGWDEPLSEPARLGVEAFNRGEYFEQHEYFEEAWKEESRPIREFYQGVLQVGVAFLLIERGAWAGAIKAFRRGLPRLRDLPPVCQGVDLAALRASATAIHAEIVALGPDRLHEFDRSQFPRINKITR